MGKAGDRERGMNQIFLVVASHVDPILLSLSLSEHILFSIKREESDAANS